MGSKLSKFSVKPYHLIIFFEQERVGFGFCPRPKLHLTTQIGFYTIFLMPNGLRS